MINRLVGYVHSQGTFTPDLKDEKGNIIRNDKGEAVKGEPIDFDNTVIDIITDSVAETENVKTSGGLHVANMKIKTEQLADYFEDVVKPDDLQAYIDYDIVLEYSFVNGKPILGSIYKKPSAHNKDLDAQKAKK